MKIDFDASKISEIERVARAEQAQLLKTDGSAAKNASVGETVELMISLAALNEQTVQMANQFSNGQTPPDNFVLVDQGGHIVAAVVSVVPAARPFGLAIAPFALGTTVFRMLVTLQQGKSIQTNDVLNLVSDVAGLVAIVTFFLGATPVTLTAAAIGTTVAAYQFLNEHFNFWSAFATRTQSMFQTYHPPPVVPTPDLMYGYNGYLTSGDQISSSNPGLAIVYYGDAASGYSVLSVEPRYDIFSADPWPGGGYWGGGGWLFTMDDPYWWLCLENPSHPIHASQSRHFL